jgi:hypothetical protein
LITDFVGYGASSLKDVQAIAKTSFCIVSYISQTLPQSQSIRFLSGNETDGCRLANAFSRGLLLPMGEWKHSPSVQSAILDLMLSNIGIETSSRLNLALVTLGQSGCKHNCLRAIVEMISNVRFVLNPKTSSSAAKCFVNLQIDATRSFEHTIFALTPFLACYSHALSGTTEPFVSVYSA